ncbi:3-hydroxyacyl-CoA dehydrogenase NAD-binding domain-containing protein, partial [Amycolatopsis sp. NPDC003731]
TGVMGRGIVQLAATAGVTVELADVRREAVTEALQSQVSTSGSHVSSIRARKSSTRVREQTIAVREFRPQSRELRAPSREPRIARRRAGSPVRSGRPL